MFTVTRNPECPWCHQVAERAVRAMLVSLAAHAGAAANG